MRNPDRPGCEDCGSKLICRGCDDARPTAEEICAGWRLMSPFDRWETVERVERPQIGPWRFWTVESGARPWHYWPDKRLNAFPPEQHLHGDPEIRIIEGLGGDGPMFAVACLSTSHRMDIPPEGILVHASTPGRGRGWKVSHTPTGAATHTVTEHDSKAKARTELRRVARALAKEYGVKLTIPTV